MSKKNDVDYGGISDMKQEWLSMAFGDIDDCYITEAFCVVFGSEVTLSENRTQEIECSERECITQFNESDA